MVQGRVEREENTWCIRGEESPRSSRVFSESLSLVSHVTPCMQMSYAGNSITATSNNMGDLTGSAKFLSVGIMKSG